MLKKDLKYSKYEINQWFICFVMEYLLDLEFLMQLMHKKEQMQLF